MINLYSIIVALFAMAGALLAIWSWTNIKKKRKSRDWPLVEASIISAQKSSPENNMLPLVKFIYQVADKTYEGVVDVPPGESAMPDFADHFLAKHPIGSSITIYYNPAQPAESSQKSRNNREDWLLFSVGTGAMLLGLILIITNL